MSGAIRMQLNHRRLSAGSSFCATCPAGNYSLSGNPSTQKSNESIPGHTVTSTAKYSWQSSRNRANQYSPSQFAAAAIITTRALNAAVPPARDGSRCDRQAGSGWSYYATVPAVALTAQSATAYSIDRRPWFAPSCLGPWSPCAARRGLLQGRRRDAGVPLPPRVVPLLPCRHGRAKLARRIPCEE